MGEHFYGFHYRTSSSAGQGLYIFGGRKADQICTLLCHTQGLQGHTGSEAIFQRGFLISQFTEEDIQ
jgi:hypothetical protein